MRVTVNMVALAFVALVSRYQPVVIEFPASQSPVPGQEYGPGVRRLDPGTVNLPLRVLLDPPNFGNPLKPKPIIVWLKRKP